MQLIFIYVDRSQIQICRDQSRSVAISFRMLCRKPFADTPTSCPFRPRWSTCAPIAWPNAPSIDYWERPYPAWRPALNWVNCKQEAATNHNISLEKKSMSNPSHLDRKLYGGATICVVANTPLHDQWPSVVTGRIQAWLTFLVHDKLFRINTKCRPATGDVQP